MHALYNAVLILYYPSESFRASPGSSLCFSSIVYATWKYVGCSCDAFDGQRTHSRNAYMNEWWKYLSSFVKEVKSTRVTEFVKTFPLSISWWTYNVLFFISTFLEQVTSSEWQSIYLSWKYIICVGLITYEFALCLCQFATGMFVRFAVYTVFGELVCLPV